MNADVKLLLVAAVGLGFFVWALTYSQQFGQVVSASTTGYGNVVKALQPGGVSGVGFNQGEIGPGTSTGMLA